VFQKQMVLELDDDFALGSRRSSSPSFLFDCQDVKGNKRGTVEVNHVMNGIGDVVSPVHVSASTERTSRIDPSLARSKTSLSKAPVTSASSAHRGSRLLLR
jgi:hypothetical protein